jgi:CRISPR/Cas system-associated protein Csm6
MQSLIEWCENTIPGYKDSGYEVLFNLTGGFKSLQGYLNVVGMFYADEIVYIFERSTELLRIPRLPIQINADSIQNYAAQLAMMEHDHIFSPDDLSGLPEGMLYYLDESHATLSNWGKLIWLRQKNDVFQTTTAKVRYKKIMVSYGDEGGEAES